MEQHGDHNAKAVICITQVRRIFLFTFIFMLLTMAIMYGTTEEFSVTSTFSFITIRNMTLVNITKDSLRKLSKSLKYESVNKLKYLEKTDNLKVDDEANWNKSTTNWITQSPTALEFPDMPDPCSKPRRSTGVEDLLCKKRPKYLPNYKNPCWLADGKLKCIGYFQLFGICKSGTSDFFKRLLLHPGIVPNRGIFGKEIWYWSWKRLQPKQRGGLTNVGMTFEEFSRQFQANIIQNKITADSYHPLITGSGDPMDFWDEFAWKLIPQNDPKADEPLWTTPYFVHHMNPNVKLLLMLRDPVERLFSHYLHSGAGSTAEQFHEHIKYSLPLWHNCVKTHTIRHCIYDADFRKTLKAPIYTSFYNIHLQEWLKVFPREQMFIFRNEDYTKDIKGTMKKLFKFLDIDTPEESILDSMEKQPHFYETKKKKTSGALKQETKKLLTDFYRPHIEELAKILGDEKFLWKDESFS